MFLLLYNETHRMELQSRFKRQTRLALRLSLERMTLALRKIRSLQCLPRRLFSAWETGFTNKSSPRARQRMVQPQQERKKRIIASRLLSSSGITGRNFQSDLDNRVCIMHNQDIFNNFINLKRLEFVSEVGKICYQIITSR